MPRLKDNDKVMFVNNDGEICHGVVGYWLNYRTNRVYDNQGYVQIYLTDCSTSPITMKPKDVILTSRLDSKDKIRKMQVKRLKRYKGKQEATITIAQGKLVEIDKMLVKLNKKGK